MRRTPKTFYSIAASMLCLPFVATPPDQFTITVPVRLVNLPIESRSVGVSCALLASATARVGSTDYLGMIYGRSPITGGTFDGDVVVSGNVDTGVDPARVTHYYCSLGISAGVRGRDVTWSYGPTARPSTLPLAPGAPLVHTVSGAIR